ncbi:MAG: Nif3-like dinuclear metal center hexameric protein [Synergistaceae bacterium]
MSETVYVKDVVKALDVITGGRVVKTFADITGGNHFVTMKTSNIPGKSVMELPGLVWGCMEAEVKCLAVLMTLTENAIELAAATGVDALVVHHPIAEGANSGGVTLKNYLGLYNLSVFELHEAFHGLHPGIAWLHGSIAHKANIAFGGTPGKIVWYGEAMPEVPTLGAMINRIEDIMGTYMEEDMLEKEKSVRCCNSLCETTLSARAKIFLGKPESPLGKTITIFPHTGFGPEDLEAAYKEYPADTLVANISRPLPDSQLVQKARELGMNLVAGSSHAMEIFENGVPLAYAIKYQLPDLDVHIFRERMVNIPLESVGTDALKEYGKRMAKGYLPRPKVE